MSNKKVALIIGGSGGIGSYLVNEFMDRGYRVIFTYCGNARMADQASGDVEGVKADVSDEGSISGLRDLIQDKYEKLDALIYAAGIFEDALVGNMSLDSWNHVMAVNLTGAFLCCKHFIHLLRKSGQGRVICIGSVMGDSGTYGSCSYAATKAGMIGLIKSVALENAVYNVTANVVSFGYIDTGMTQKLTEKVLESAKKKIPAKKLGDPCEAAKITADLCEEHTGYITGQVIRINGGLYV